MSLTRRRSLFLAARLRWLRRVASPPLRASGSLHASESLVVRLSLTARWVRQARKIERALPAHVETGTAVDELELANDPAGPRHRDVHHLGRTTAETVHGPRI